MDEQAGPDITGTCPILVLGGIKDTRVLSSWKEIANFFDVSVRTVQRWEKSSDLPVYRQDSGRPVAYIEELQRWQDRQTGKEQVDTSPDVVRPLLATSTIVLILLAGFVWQSTSGGGLPSKVTLEEQFFVVRDEAGGRLWDFELPEVVLPERYTYDAPLDTSLLADIDDDGAREVLFNFRTPAGSQTSSKLYCFNEDGGLRWELELGREREFGGRQFTGDYSGHFVRLVRDKTGRSYILTVAQHRYWHPCQVALLDPRSGNLVEEYWHPGGISHCLVRDLDGDGVDEIILGGVNNPGPGLGHASLFSLKIPFSSSPQKTDSPFAEFTGGREHHYLLFPRPDTAFVSGTLLQFNDLIEIDSATMLARLRISAEGGMLLYFFDNNFQLTDFGISDNVLSVHDRLWLKGLLDHRFSEGEELCLARTVAFSTAPDGNNPDLAHQWQECEFRQVEID